MTVRVLFVFAHTAKYEKGRAYFSDPGRSQRFGVKSFETHPGQKISVPRVVFLTESN
jgi:hypothetical protein